VLALFYPGRSVFAQEVGKDSISVVKKDNLQKKSTLSKTDTLQDKKVLGKVDSTGKNVASKVNKEILKELKMPLSQPHTKKDSLSSADKAKQGLPKTDSLHLKETLAKKLGLNDSTNIFKKLEKSVKTSGNVSMGYDYGVVPFTTSTTMPLGFYKAEGNSKVQIMTLPFDVSFYFSDLQNISGLHNYFRMSFDSKKYQDDMKQKAGSMVDGQKAKLGDLYKERQTMEKKLYYLKSFPDPSGFEEGAEKSVPIPTISKTSAVPALPKDSVKLPGDSLKKNEKGGMDSLAKAQAKEKHEADSVATALKVYQHQYDSIQKVIVKYQKQIDKIEWDILNAKRMIKLMEDPKTIGNQEAPYLSKGENMMLKVKKLDVGLCYPNNSSFLISGSAIKGVNLEMENENFFFSFTHGKTLSTLVYTNNVVQNSLSNTQNLYNFFDFKNITDSRQVTAIKFGPGKKDETHLHVGFMYGIGSSSYPFEVNASAPLGFKYEKNYVIELDGKVVINKNNMLDLVYGKSSLLQSSTTFGDINKGVNSIFDPLRSNAALARFTTSIPKTKTKITLSSRWVDPFFNSYGVGFMRADNFRYEFKVEQPITAKIKLTALFRKEQDNLLSFYNYSTNLTTIGANLSVKLNRCLTVRVGYNPVLQTVSTKDNSYSLNNHNNISNLVLTYNPHMKGFSTAFNALYSYYNLTNAIQTNVFESVNLNNTTQIKSGFRLISSATWFHSSVIDTNGNNTMLIVEEVGYSFKKGAMISIGGKAAHNSVVDWQYGYMAKVMLPIVKHFSIEASFEKIVIGDFYNSFNRAQIQKFPYYCSLKVIYNW
jgi:hypothetical protein